MGNDQTRADDFGFGNDKVAQTASAECLAWSGFRAGEAAADYAERANDRIA